MTATISRRILWMLVYTGRWVCVLVKQLKMGSASGPWLKARRSSSGRLSGSCTRIRVRRCGRPSSPSGPSTIEKTAQALQDQIKNQSRTAGVCGQGDAIRDWPPRALACLSNTISQPQHARQGSRHGLLLGNSSCQSLTKPAPPTSYQRREIRTPFANSCKQTPSVKVGVAASFGSSAFRKLTAGMDTLVFSKSLGVVFKTPAHYATIFPFRER
jgi:hypothetical protein